MKLDFDELMIMRKAPELGILCMKDLEESERQVVLTDEAKQMCENAADRGKMLSAMYLELTRKNNKSYDTTIAITDLGNEGFMTSCEPPTKTEVYNYHIITDKDNDRLVCQVNIWLGPVLIQFELRFDKKE